MKLILFALLFAGCNVISKPPPVKPCPPHDTVYIQGPKYDTNRVVKRMQYQTADNECIYILTFETFNVLDSIHSEERPYFDSVYVTRDTVYHRDTTYTFEIICNDTTLVKRDSIGWIFYNYGRALEAVYKAAIIEFERNNQ